MANEPKPIKTCITCKYKQDEYNHVNQKIFLCSNQFCKDPVIGEPIPCNIARQQQIFCGFEGRFYEQSEPEVKAPLIELVKK